MPRKGKKGNKQPQQVEQQDQCQEQEHRPVAVEDPLGSGSIAELTTEVSKVNISAAPEKPSLPIELVWNRSGKGSFNNPYTSIEEKAKHRGTKGRKIKLLANHFPMNIKLTKVYRYEVSIKPPWKRPLGKKDKPLMYRAIEEMKKNHADKEFPPQLYCVVYDGRSTLISTHELKLKGKFSTTVKIPEDSEDLDRLVELKMQLTFVDAVPIQPVVEQFEKGRSGQDVQPLEPIQMLNIILSYAFSVDPLYEVMGTRYFQPSNKDRISQIDAGKYVWQGTFQSARVGWKIRLNIDVANKPAYQKCNLMEFLKNYLWAKNWDDFTIMMSQNRNNAVAKASAEIKDLKARFIRPDGAKRDYRMNRLVKNPVQQKFKLETGEELSVDAYFKRQYDYDIKHKSLPCIHVGDPKKRNYLPMECLELKQQVCPQSKVLGDATSQMIKVTAVRPDKRQARILENLKEMKSKSQPYAQAFGISVLDKFSEIDARVLNPPLLLYNKPNPNVIQPRDGKWNASNGPQFLKPQALTSWAILDTVTLFKDQMQLLIESLMNEARRMGMEPRDPQVYSERNYGKVDKAFHDILAHGKLQILVVILESKNNDFYQNWKLEGDTKASLPTQFVLKKNATGKGKGQPPSAATIHNIVLKINSKLGGTNQALAPVSRSDLILSDKKPMLGEPIMVVGADVTHPAPELLGVKPSIAAVVASVDPSISQYVCEVRVQYRGKDEIHVTEQILDMENIFTDLLKRFRDHTKYPPKRIVFYRDGVSEGQFQMVLNKEISAMQRACYNLNPNFQPGITYFVAQKRHHTRLFPQNPREGLRNGNVLPGTVVDTDIIHPTVSSFFMASHEGIQGTTKPTYYVKLYDDNDLSADVEQALTFYLCHLYSRCERSVSYPAPTYYAHLAAFRARDHYDALLRKYGNDYRNIPSEEMKLLEKLQKTNYFV